MENSVRKGTPLGIWREKMYCKNNHGNEKGKLYAQ